MPLIQPKNPQDIAVMPLLNIETRDLVRPYCPSFLLKPSLKGEGLQQIISRLLLKGRRAIIR